MSAPRMLLAAALALLPAGGALAQITVGQPAPVGPLTCGDFIRNPNGTWSPMHPVTIPGQSMAITIGPATELRPGPVFPGAQLAATLNANCG